jgi:thiol-disulfide isomerase/thioredoxin
MRGVVGLAAVVVLMLTGCAGPQTGSQGSAATSSAPAATASAPSPSPSPTATAAPGRPTPSAPRAPDTLSFRGTTVDGRPFDGASLAGKPVLLWFWAPWCPTCRSQIRQVQEVARDYAGEVAVIGVGSLADAAAIKAFAADVPGPTHLVDESGAIYRHFEVVQQSSFVLLDAEGRTVWSVGYGGSDDLSGQVAVVAG